MTCAKYKQHELGEISARDYQAHLKECPVCREIIRQDAFILKQVKENKKPVAAPQLWQRIKWDLQNEGDRIPKIPVRKRSMYSLPFLKLAASFLIPVLLIASYFLFLKPEKSSGLLNEIALKKVEKMENAYMAAISELEETVKPGMTSLNIDLALNYRDRLETIDEQINRCKEELKLNPTNTHIRRYLLAAMQDKQQTLLELNELRRGATGTLIRQ